MTLKEELQTRNFSIYGQWIAIINIILCIALGIANIFHVNWVIAFSIVAIVQGLVVIFVEIPFLLKICPLTDRFINFVKSFNQNLPRAGFYLIMAAIQYVSCAAMVTSLLAIAIMFTLSSLCYGLAALKGQEFMTSSTLGGAGIARQIL